MSVLLFDLFGVIARHQSPQGRRALEKTAEIPDFWQLYWQHRVAYDEGKVTGPGYWRTVGRFTDEQIARLIEADIASWSEVDDEMVALVERAANDNIRLGLLSNIPEELAQHYERHEWMRHFELVAFSCRIGLAKPDPAAFTWCCRKLGLAPDQVLFVDDRAENIAAADEVGLHTHLFTTVGEGLDLVQRVRDLGTG